MTKGGLNRVPKLFFQRVPDDAVEFKLCRIDFLDAFGSFPCCLDVKDPTAFAEVDFYGLAIHSSGVVRSRPRTTRSAVKSDPTALAEVDFYEHDP